MRMKICGIPWTYINAILLLTSPMFEPWYLSYRTNTVTTYWKRRGPVFSTIWVSDGWNGQLIIPPTDRLWIDWHAKMRLISVNPIVCCCAILRVWWTCNRRNYEATVPMNQGEFSLTFQFHHSWSMSIEPDRQSNLIYMLHVQNKLWRNWTKANVIFNIVADLDNDWKINYWGFFKFGHDHEWFYSPNEKNPIYFWHSRLLIFKNS